ncbi:hypothetical protein OIV83_003325 [Microbotryomycetes sp. JL201]|nr:hypothetical protein OIV83_003325 [Microbotryomycetes sp. JL201]
MVDLPIASQPTSLKLGSPEDDVGGSGSTGATRSLLASSTFQDQPDLDSKVEDVWSTNASRLHQRTPSSTRKGKARAEKSDADVGTGDGDMGYAMSDMRPGVGERAATDSGSDLALSRRHSDDVRHESTDSFPPEQGDEDDKEAKRIADHLAQWSRIEAQKRKNARKSQVIVLPAAPVPTNLARRSSALVRAGSKRLSRSVDQATNGHAGASLIDQESKTAQRRQSALLRGNSVDSAIEPALVLADIEEDTAQTECASDNPFASRPPSAVRATSYDTVSTSATPTSSRHDSVFMEDLVSSAPPLGHRPPSDASNPFADSMGQTRPRGDTMSSQHSDATIRLPYGAVKMASPPLSSPKVLADEYQELTDDPYDESTVGWLDLVLCNCFRSRDGTDDDVQVGRTNPNE